MPAVAKHHLLHVPHSEPVHVNQAGRDLVTALHRLGAEVDRLAVFHDGDP